MLLWTSKVPHKTFSIHKYFSILFISDHENTTSDILNYVISVPVCPRASRTPGRCAEQQVQDQVVPEVLGGRILCLRAQVQLPARRGQDDVRDCRQGG